MRTQEAAVTVHSLPSPPPPPVAAEPADAGGAAAPPKGSGGGSSRRLVAAGVVLAVLVAAWFVGGRGSSSSSKRATPTAGSTTEASGAGAGSAGNTASAPPTTVPGPSGGSDGDGSDVARDEAATAAGGASTGVAPGEPGGGGVIDTTVGPKIVRTGSVDVVVARGAFERSYARLATVATGAGGFVSASETSALDDTPRGTVTLRVPVARFDQVLVQVRKLGTVESVTTGSQDVTGEYSDVKARIHALEAEREQIQLVLGRAENIPDILAVRDRLNVVQSELEQLQGRQKVLDDQTSLSTLTVSLREKGSTRVLTTTPPAERTGPAALWHDAADRFASGIRSIALGLATLAPWLLLAAVLWLPARALWKRLGTGPRPDHPAAAPPAP